MCLDPRDLNRAIQSEHYPFPAIEDTAAQSKSILQTGHA